MKDFTYGCSYVAKFKIKKKIFKFKLFHSSSSFFIQVQDFFYSSSSFFIQVQDFFIQVQDFFNSSSSFFIQVQALLIQVQDFFIQVQALYSSASFTFNMKGPAKVPDLLFDLLNCTPA